MSAAVWQQPWTTYELNIQCQLNLLEALRRWQPACRTLVVTSNEVYGLVEPEDLPIDEETPFRPNSPYGVSKIAQDMMALQYWNSHHLPIVRVRSFNHMGPGQSDDFAASAFARQIAEIEAGLREPVVRVGNLERRTRLHRCARRRARLLAAGTARRRRRVSTMWAADSRTPIRWLLDTLLDLTPVAR